MSTSDPSDCEKDVLATEQSHEADKSVLDDEGLRMTKEEDSEAGGDKDIASLAAAGDLPTKSDRILGRGNAERNADVEKNGAAAAIAERPEDPNVVDWDGPNDSENPVNWSNAMKVVTVGLVSGICFVTPLASSMFAPGVPQLMQEFQSTNIELGTIVVSIYVLGFAAGPMVLAPLSELYGRVPVYHACNIGFLIFNIACAVSSSLNMLIAFRFIAGVFGSAPLTNGGGTIADCVKQEHRGAAMSLFVIGPLVGPVIGPLAGGYLAQAKGWRWVFWILSILNGFFTILSLVFMRETYAVTILKRKTKRLQKEMGNPNLRSKLDLGLTPKELFLLNIVRPAKMLVLSPIVLSTSIYVGIVYGYLYLLFTTFTGVFEGQYGFSTGSVGLTYLGLGIGSLIGLCIIGVSSDRILKAKTKPNPDGTPGEMKPEYRLPPMVYAAVCIPVGLFIYGWTAYYKVHYIVPIFGTMLIGIGNLAVFMCVSTYLIDAFTIHAASVLAANTLVRSTLGAILPLAGPRMYETLGLGWGNSLLGFIAVACLPIPFVLNRYGEGIRKKFDLTGRI